MGYELTIEPIGQTIEVEDGQTILDASLRAGIYLPHACCHGLCATCKVHVVDGDVDHGEASNFALMDYERDEGLTLACCARLESDVTIEAEIDEEPDARNLPVQDYSGVVSRLVDLTPTVKGVWITLDEGHELDFQAGQYVNLAVPGEPVPRAFSLANPPSRTREVELNVRFVPGGKATTWIHHGLDVGERVTFSAPYGRFFVRRSQPTALLFLAGGSGLSSPRSMILDLLETGWELPITLVYGARNAGELYYHEDFVRLADEHGTFTYVPALSDEPADSSWAGFRGYVHEAAKAHFDNDFRGNTAYLCGPPPMIDAAITTLMQGRLFERSIYTEKFISAADASNQMRSPLFRRI
jgi:phenol/toluene 2-monooxygenase (NADH) P5/A5